MDNCYNFVHPHMGLKGRTPAEEANINLELERNKLMILIKLFHNDHVYLQLRNNENFSGNFICIPIIRQYNNTRYI